MCENRGSKFTRYVTPAFVFQIITIQLIFLFSLDVFSTNCVDVEKDSISSQDSDSFREKTNPILPLILTLVFLILGIIALVVVYFIAKSHSSSWRRSPGRNRQRRRWPFSWPFRRHQRRDGHESVAQADELSLHDNLTVRSLIPEE